MKKQLNLLVATVCLMATTSHAQIQLENEYPVASGSRISGLTMIKLEVSGDKYFLYDMPANTIRLYNLDHSVFKTIPIPALPKYRSTNTSSMVSIAYISENLFNGDNQIEYVAMDHQYASYITPSEYGSMRVFNENGAIVFDGDSLMPCFKRDATYYGYEGEGDFIFNTSQGSKMILFKYGANLKQRVYSLPGTVNSTKENLTEKNQQKPYPNPGSSYIVLPYQLENNAEGQLTVYGINGQLIKEYVIDKTFDHLRLDISAYEAGNYFYTVSEKNKVISKGRFLVNKE
jgi:hypothetical protein